MKGGVAVMLKLAAALTAPNRDVTYCFYDCEEVDSERNGLRRVAEHRPEWLAADFAVLMEPTDGTVEGGCKGTLRVEVRTKGIASHSARPWVGHNAIHDAGEVLARLVAYEARVVDVEGLTYREALQAVLISGGTASNVIPDACAVTVNYRYAPDRSEDEAVSHVREVFAGFEVEVTDNAGGARPGLDRPAARAFGRWGSPSRPRRAGPTWRGSLRWVCRPSTSGPATRCWRTWTTSGHRSSNTSTPRPRCSGGFSPDPPRPSIMSVMPSARQPRG
jgi:succinyl-diaminopimelate desuccinylase